MSRQNSLTKIVGFRWQLRSFVQLISVTLVSIGLMSTSYANSYPDKRPLPLVYKYAKAINYSPDRGAGPAFFRDFPNIVIPSDADILQDLKLLNHAGYRLIRLFGGFAQRDILELAQDHYPHLKFQVGIALNGPCGSEVNDIAINEVIDQVNTYDNAATVSVGNEVVFFNILSITCLADYIQHVRDNVTIPVTTDEIGSLFYSGFSGDISTILNKIDFVSYHEYPYFTAALNLWDWRQTGVSPEHRAKAMMRESLHYMKRIFHDVSNYEYTDINGAITTTGKTHPIVIGETGWKAYRTVLPGTYPNNPDIFEVDKYTSNPVNQKWYLDLLNKWLFSSRALPFVDGPENILVFSSMDEYWKNDGGAFDPNIDYGIGDGGWGLWNVVRAPNYALCGPGKREKCKRDRYAGAGYFGLEPDKDPMVTVEASQRWLGNVATFGFIPWPVGFLSAFFTAPEPGEGELVIQSLPFEAGVVEKSIYLESRDSLVGKTVTFSGECLRDTLQDGFVVNVFIQGFDNNFIPRARASTDLRAACAGDGTFSITREADDSTIIQYGFQMIETGGDLPGEIVIKVE